MEERQEIATPDVVGSVPLDTAGSVKRTPRASDPLARTALELFDRLLADYGPRDFALRLGRPTRAGGAASRSS